MEERKPILGYIAEVFLIFGIVMFIMNILCTVYGEAVKEYSSMFALGREGISIDTMMQFFVVSIIVVCIKFIFFTETFIRKMSVVLRTIGMLTVMLLIFSVFIVKFRWFPVNLWEAWVHFFICFAVSFAASTAVTIWRERVENEKMQEALWKLKNREESGDEKRD